jgi:mRNA-degrading endonuclease YafQ of YafQ-DinJ toxin-antitoxin module
MKLEHSEQFKKDLNRYRSALERMPTVKSKNQLEYLIQTLISEIRYLDSQHDELNISKTLPSTVVDSRSKISSVRGQIENLLK